MARVVLRQVSKVYPGGVRAVDGVDLAVDDEQFVVLVGPSGCGKSTTLRMVAGLEEVSTGEVEIGGRVVNDVPPKDRDIAMVFQNYALYPHMTVYKNMAFGLKLRRRELKFSRADIDRKVREAARTLGIENLLDRKPRALSGGQRQRVAVGRAIVRDPKAFLFDEPLSNVDAQMRIEMRNELKNLHRRLRTTTLYVTHDQEEAMTLGDRIVVMKEGRIQQSGTPTEVYQRPANRFVGSFIGTPSMNFLKGRAVAGANGAVFETDGTRIQLDERLSAAAGGNFGREMVLGIRPEALSTDPSAGEVGGRCERCGQGLRGRYCHGCGAESRSTAGGGRSRPFLEAKAVVVESLGGQEDVHCSTSGGLRVTARMDAPSGVDEGDAVRLYVDLSGAHLFESGATGSNLSLPREGVTERVA